MSDYFVDIFGLFMPSMTVSNRMRNTKHYFNDEIRLKTIWFFDIFECSIRIPLTWFKYTNFINERELIDQNRFKNWTFSRVNIHFCFKCFEVINNSLVDSLSKWLIFHYFYTWNFKLNWITGKLKLIACHQAIISNIFMFYIVFFSV